MRPVDYAVGRIVILITAVMVSVIAVDVFLRFFFNDSLPFANELSRMMFVWMIYLGLPLALSRGRHVGITILDNALTRGAARFALRLGTVIVMALLGLVLVIAIRMVGLNWDQDLYTLPISAAWFFIPLPIAAVHSLAHLTVIFIVGNRAPLGSPDDFSVAPE